MSNKYSLSKNFQSVRFKDIYFCFNSLTGRYAVVDRDTYRFFKMLQKKQHTEVQLEAITKQENIREVLKEYIKYDLIVNNNNDEQRKISKQREKWEDSLRKQNKISFLGFTVTDKCNFRCVYCVKRKCDSLSKKDKEYTLRWKTAKKALDQFFKIVLYNKRKNIAIGFIGGEPLLNFEIIKKIVGYTKKVLSSHKRVSFAITTNGVLINKEISKFFASNNFKIGVSLDGLREANNKVRVYKNGKGTFDDILLGIRNLERYYPAKKIVISTTLSKGNFDLVDTNFLDFVRSLGIRELSLEPDLIALVSNDYQKIVKKLFKLYKYGKLIGLNVYGYWSKPFAVLLKNRMSPIAFCAPLRGEAIGINSQGRVQLCSYINELSFPVNKLYKINTIPKYKDFIMNRWKGNLQECKGCELEGICLGGCYVTHNMSKKVFNYRCFLYKQLTRLLIKQFLKENYKRIRNSFSK